VNQNRTHADLRHAFNLVPEAPPALVQLPATTWGGQYPVTGYPTIVNMLALGDLAEGVYRRVVAANRRGALVTRLPDDEFTARYFMLVGIPV